MIAHTTRPFAALAIGICCGLLSAQQQQPQQPQQQQQPDPTSPFYDPTQRTDGRGGQQSPLDSMGLDQVDIDPSTRIWMRPDAFQGFPVFPPNLGTYGLYPPPPGFGQPPPVTGEMPPTVPDGAPDWPSWIKQKELAALPYEVGVAALVRQSDRVWHRAPGEDAFVPLYHYDTMRALQPGHEVRVPHTGNFLVLLYGGGRLASVGQGELRIEQLDEKGARFTIKSFTRLELDLPKLGAVLVLPDGSELQVDEAPSDTEGPVKGLARVHLIRDIEPGYYGGRAVIWNGGNRSVRWQHKTGTVQLDPGYRVTMLLTPPPAPLGSGLVQTNVESSADGPRRRWSATQDGSITWSGARFVLSSGEQLTIDPMLGDPFAPVSETNKEHQ